MEPSFIQATPPPYGLGVIMQNDNFTHKRLQTRGLMILHTCTQCQGCDTQRSCSVQGVPVYGGDGHLAAVPRGVSDLTPPTGPSRLQTSGAQATTRWTHRGHMGLLQAEPHMESGKHKEHNHNLVLTSSFLQTILNIQCSSVKSNPKPERDIQFRPCCM